jgi:hypothetical protein
MSQAQIDKYTEQFFPTYAVKVSAPEVKAAVKRIMEEEITRGTEAKLSALDLSRGIRSRVSELLQLIVPLPDASIAVPAGPVDPGWLRKQLDDHHHAQTGHFTALWRHVDALAKEAGVKLEGGAP